MSTDKIAFVSSKWWSRYKSLLNSSSDGMPLVPAVRGKSTASYVVQLQQASLPPDSRYTMPKRDLVTWSARFERITRFPHGNTTGGTTEATLPEHSLPARTFYLKLNYGLDVPQTQFNPVARTFCFPLSLSNGNATMR